MLRLPVTTSIPQRELRNDSGRVLAAVEAGQSFVITRHGRPVAELRPVRDGRRTFVPTAELLELFVAGPALDAGSFRADSDRLLDDRLRVPHPRDERP